MPPDIQNNPLWAKRLREHMALHKQSQESLAASMGLTQGAIGHWLNGRRDISLKDFLSLCWNAGADPKYILFGNTSEEPLSRIRQILDSHPEANPAYRAFEKGVKLPKKRASKTP